MHHFPTQGYIYVSQQLISMTRFCPTCGKPDTAGKFSGELCLECAMERISPLPVARVSVCQKCGAVIDKGNKRKDVSVEGEAARVLKLGQCKPIFSADFTSVEYESRYGRVSQPLTFLLEKRLCTDCSRAHSQYFEAIIQLRGEPARVERMAKILLRRVESRSFVPKIEELKEGLDIYCGSRNEAISALNSQQLGFLRTEKLAGEKNGKRLYRTTLLVRL